VQLSSREKNLIIVAIAVLAFAIYYTLILTPAMNNWQLLEQQINDANKQLDELQKVADINKYKNILIRKGGILETRIDDAEVLKSISYISANHDAVIGAITRDNGQVNADGDYSVVSFAISTIIPFSQTVGFLDDVNNNIKYVHNINDVNIDNNIEQQNGSCKLDFKLNVYYSPKYGVNDVQ